MEIFFCLISIHAIFKPGPESKCTKMDSDPVFVLQCIGDVIWMNGYELSTFLKDQDPEI